MTVMGHVLWDTPNKWTNKQKKQPLPKCLGGLGWRGAGRKVAQSGERVGGVGSAWRRARTLGQRTRLPAQTLTSCSGAWPRTTRGCFFPFVLNSVALGQCEIFNFICRRKKEFDLFLFFFFFLTFLFLHCTYLYAWWCYKARSANTLFQWQVFCAKVTRGGHEWSGHLK